MRDYPLIESDQWEIHNIQMPSEARRIADRVAVDAPDPFSVGDGLTELILNGIEHGNLEIGRELKGELLAKGLWGKELAKRFALPRYARRKVQLLAIKSLDMLTFIITDEGRGFDYRNMQTEPIVGALNGRGIKLAREMAFDKVEYKGQGNIVIAQIAL